MGGSTSKAENPRAMVCSGLTTSESYECEWNIENFILVQNHPELLFSQHFSFETDRNSDCHSKWVIRLYNSSKMEEQVNFLFGKEESSIFSDLHDHYFRIGCQLEKIYGKVTQRYVAFSARLPPNGKTFEVSQLVKMGERILLPKSFEYNSCFHRENVDSNGTFKMQIKLKTLTPAATPASVEISPSPSAPLASEKDLRKAMGNLKLEQVD